jgi:hypothetical protein
LWRQIGIRNGCPQTLLHVLGSLEGGDSIEGHGCWGGDIRGCFAVADVGAELDLMRYVRVDKCGGAGVGMELDIRGTGKAVALIAKPLLEVERGVIAVVMVGK